jgi:hypothetical protein
MCYRYLPGINNDVRAELEKEAHKEKLSYEFVLERRILDLHHATRSRRKRQES